MSDLIYLKMFFRGDLRCLGPVSPISPKRVVAQHTALPQPLTDYPFEELRWFYFTLSSKPEQGVSSIPLCQPQYCYSCLVTTDNYLVFSPRQDHPLRKW